VTIDGWRPRNATRTHQGPVSLREAFARSINTISAKIGQQLGFSTIADMARRFGISSRLDTNPSMVLGTNDVRLIDMTRAFASVGSGGTAVVPHAIRRVATSEGRLLYTHERDQGRVLVAPWVAADMIDLLQAAVMTGTGRAAQLGRPVAGKTGTSQSNRDGWFIGFSSGLTTGVWMGRDDARPVSGLQGGTAPARAFQSFMLRAVAGRPVEQFETEVPMPDWNLEPEEELWGFPEGDTGFEPLVDEDGNPIGMEPVQPSEGPGVVVAPRPGAPGTGTVDQQWLDEVLPQANPRQQQQQQQRPPPRRQPQVVRPQPPRQQQRQQQQQPRSAPDPLEPLPAPSQ
jgi:penicillin-binding protein 1A